MSGRVPYVIGAWLGALIAGYAAHASAAVVFGGIALAVTGLHFLPKRFG